jgi:hypothetical protein
VELNEELLSLWRSLGDTKMVVRTLARLAITSTMRGDRDGAQAWLRDATSIATELGTDIALAIAGMAEAVVVLDSGRLDEAPALCERALHSFRSAGAPVGVAGMLTYLGLIALRQERDADATLLFRESLRTREHAKFLWSIDSDLAGLAGVATARGQPAVAAVLLGAAEATREVSGTGQEPFEAGLQAQTEAAVRRSLDVDALQAALSEGRAMTVEAAAAYAFAYVDRTV